MDFQTDPDSSGIRTSRPSRTIQSRSSSKVSQTGVVPQSAVHLLTTGCGPDMDQSQLYISALLADATDALSLTSGTARRRGEQTSNTDRRSDRSSSRCRFLDADSSLLLSDCNRTTMSECFINEDLKAATETTSSLLYKPKPAGH